MLNVFHSAILVSVINDLKHYASVFGDKDFTGSSVSFIVEKNNSEFHICRGNRRFQSWCVWERKESKLFFWEKKHVCSTTSWDLIVTLQETSIELGGNEKWKNQSLKTYFLQKIDDFLLPLLV